MTSSTLGVRHWFQAGATPSASDLTRHAREFGIAFVSDDGDEEELGAGEQIRHLLKKECVSPSNGLPPVPPLIPLSSVRHPGAYGGVFMVNSEEGVFGDSGSEFPQEYSDEGVLVNGDGEVEKVKCSESEQGCCSVVLDPLPGNLLRSLDEDGRISATEAVRSCDCGETTTTSAALPLERRSSSESAVRGLLQDLVSAVATQGVREGEGEREQLARCQRQESLLQHDNNNTGGSTAAIDLYDFVDEEEEVSRDSYLSRRPRQRKVEEAPRATRRRREERCSTSSGGNKSSAKRRKRSTSCSTTSSAGSATHRHHRKHHHHRHHRRRSSRAAERSPTPPATPRVNPIFVWIKQDDTRIVEVLCEDYDHRNRIRLTKTAHGWRAIPRTERLASACSTSSSSGGSKTSPPPTAGGGEQAAKQYEELPTDGSAHQSDLVPEETVEPGEPVLENTKEVTEVLGEDDEVEEEVEVEESNVLEEDMQQEYVEEVEEEHSDHNYVQTEVEGDLMEEPTEAMAEDEEPLEPTDLSIPKPCDDSDVPLPRRVMTPVLPAPPTPQPIASPKTPLPTPPLTPAHRQQHKSAFLESLLSSPRKCHQQPVRHITGPEPLDLGRASGSPTVSCSEEKKQPPISPEMPSPKSLKPVKVEDITLKNLLSKQTKGDIKLPPETTITEKDSDPETPSKKSRLLELLTSVPAPAQPEYQDPITQLKKMIADPDQAIPDPLLIPKDCLSNILMNPAKEIPRLLSARPELRLPEAPIVLRDPDLLVVSLAALQQHLSKKTDEDSTSNGFLTLHEWQRFQAEIELAAQLKRKHQQSLGRNGTSEIPGEVDVARAAALNQMLWLPYLSQLEAAALACGNNQEFLAMLNAVFPPSSYSPTGQQQQQQQLQSQYPFLTGVPPFATADYKTQLELQQTLALWQEAMMQAAISSGNMGINNNNLKSASANAAYKTQHQNHTNGRFPQPAKKFNLSSARTSPISPNFHSNHQASQRTTSKNNHEYLLANGYANLSNNHQYNHQQRSRHHQQQQQALRTHLPPPKLEPELQNGKLKSNATCKSLLNLLAHKQDQEVNNKHSHLLAALGKPSVSTNPKQEDIPKLLPIPSQETTPMDLSGSSAERGRFRIKVKDHLVDPNLRPQLLKQEALQSPDSVSSSGDKAAQLWHPLFGRTYKPERRVRHLSGSRGTSGPDRVKTWKRVVSQAPEDQLQQSLAVDNGCGRVASSSQSSKPPSPCAFCSSARLESVARDAWDKRTGMNLCS